MFKLIIKSGLISLSCLVLISLVGCSEGVFWRTGNWSPWARQKWAEEEQIAKTLFTRRQEMTDMVDSLGGQYDKVAPERHDQVAQHLSDIVRNDSVLLSRLHAIGLLARVDSPISAEALRGASQDRNTDIRIAAVNALGKSRLESSVTTLQEVLNSDTNVDVRLAATRALGSTSSPQSLQALSGVLGDKNPALQVTATESLARITGQDLGADVFAWREHLGQSGAIGQPAQPPTSTAANPIGDQGSGSRLR